MLAFLFYLTQVSQVYGEFDKDSIDTLIEEALECYPGTAAFAVSAVKDGEVIYNEAFGKASIENDIKATTNTRFSIGSISKEFTAYMAGVQVAEKHYKWQDKITDIFQKYNVKMSLQGEFRNKACSLEDMLSHKTGIKTYDLLLSENSGVTRQQWATQYLPKFEQMFEMRSKFYYNNWFYTLAGYLIELVGGSPFEEQVKSTIFAPLGMTDTCFVSDKAFDELGQDLSQPYKEGSDGTLYPIPISALKLISPHNPAGGIISTSTDMAKYMVGVIDGFNDKNGAVLSKRVLESITQPKMLMEIQLGDSVVIQKPAYPESFTDKGYAYGHIIGTYRGLEYVNHGGSTYGHYSFITVVPAKKVGVFTVISGDDYQNRDNFRMQRLVQLYLIDVMLGETPWLDANKICSFPETPDRRSAAASSWEPVANPDMYVGNYSNPVFPVMQLSKDGTNLKFKMGNTNGTVVQAPTQDQAHEYSVLLNMPMDPVDLPEVDKQTAALSFVLDGEGNKVDKLHLHWGPEDFEFSGVKPRVTKYCLLLLALFYVLT